MSLQNRTVVYAQIALSLLTGILSIGTILWRDWIETLVGWDLDRHNGLLEWVIAATLGMAMMQVAATLRTWERSDVAAATRKLQFRANIARSERLADNFERTIVGSRNENKAV